MRLAFKRGGGSQSHGTTVGLFLVIQSAHFAPKTLLGQCTPYMYADATRMRYIGRAPRQFSM